MKMVRPGCESVHVRVKRNAHKNYLKWKQRVNNNERTQKTKNEERNPPRWVLCVLKVLRFFFFFAVYFFKPNLLFSKEIVLRQRKHLNPMKPPSHHHHYIKIKILPTLDTIARRTNEKNNEKDEGLQMRMMLDVFIKMTPRI